MPSAWSYARVSSVEQATAGRGIQRQQDDSMARAWCERHGYLFAETFTFTGSAYTGSHLKGDAPLRCWLDQAKAGALGPNPALLVEEIDRFTREAGHRLLGELAQIFDAGIWVVALRDGVIYSAEAFERDDRLLVDLMDEIRAAHRYSLRLSRRLTSYWGQVRDRLADGGAERGDRLAPWWISATPDGKAWMLNDRAPIARQMFERALEVGTATIAREFNEQAIAPVTPGTTWKSGSIARHLRNPSAYGLLRLLSRTDAPIDHEDHFPPLVTRDEWELVQAALRERIKNPAARSAQGQCHWIGQRLTRCTCGATVEVFCSTPRPGKHYRYLACQRRRHERGVCHGRSYKLDVVTAHLLTRLQPQQLALMLNGGAPQDHLAAAMAAADAARQAVTLAEQQENNATAALEASILKGDGADLLLPIVRRAQDHLQSTRHELGVALQNVAAAQGRQMPVNLAADVAAMLERFAAGDDTAAQRRRVHDGLRRLGLVIHLDPKASRCGLQMGGGKIDWQPVDPELSRGALGAGATAATFFGDADDGIGAGVEWPA